MRLTSIQMQGFKSFADKIYLDFNSGITAIVGPNGSGKSNISDAIRWVMGEQSIKSLRGSRMEDVIFSGTEARKALGFAEVTLVLDNTDGYFPLDFPEITVTRRVYRSGEGEYYINKTLCRLKDIHELFMDTGLGRDGYSIIGQGKIDSILSTKSEDRRQIFEEAAGISKYKYRKLEAERKLAQTVENLTRVQDILSELSNQIEPLSRQAEKAKKYLVLRDELRGLDISVSVTNIERIKEDFSKLSADLEILNSQIDSINAELSETDAQISAMYDRMREFDNKIAEYSDEERSIALKISEAEKSIGILQNDIEHNESNIERLEIEVESILKSAELATEEIELHKARIAELNSENNRITAEIDEVSGLLARSGENAGEKGGELEGIKSEIIDITSELNSLRGSVENYKILSDSFMSRRSDIISELENKTKDRAELDSQLKTASADEDTIRSSVENLEGSLRIKENDLKSKKDESVRLVDSKNKHLVELSSKRSRRTMLMDMEREFEGYGKGVKSVMVAYNENKLCSSGIFGPLAQLIRTDKKYITAIDTALGNAGQNIVTESEDEAKIAISYLKENKLGRATFLPVSTIKPKSFDKASFKSSDGYISIASDLVDCDAKYEDIVKSFLGTTVVCDNIDNAIVMARKNNHKIKIVTLDGEVIQPGGAMSGGSAVKTTGTLSRTGEIETLATDIDKLKSICDKEEKSIEALGKELIEVENSIVSISNELQDARADLVRKASSREKLSALLESLDKTSAQFKSELDDIDARLSEISVETDAKNKLINENINKRSELESTAIGIQEEYSKLAGENERLAGRLTELNITKSTIFKDIELENERVASITDTKGEYIESVNIKRGGIETLKNRNASINQEITDLIAKGEEYKQSAQSCRKSSEELNATRISVEQDVRKCQNDIKETQERKFDLSQRASKIENKADKLTEEREAIINRMWEDYELTYSDAVELRKTTDFDFKEATQRIRELKNLIKNLGNINVDSIEEYKNVKERFDFLTVQTQDLEKAKAELDSVISEMMAIMKTRFEEQFEIINANFNRVFCELFGGGRATLSLIDPENVLESGIDIEAQPPGKKLQSLTLLSGGEKAFTAIALLFAILDVRPTPFCILDEIEAALDDVNVYRYADYLKKYSNKTQFIVVTHRRGTMEAANILYGVTMQERGVSKLLSLNIDEVKE